jgi:hypothetical protein
MIVPSSMRRRQDQRRSDEAYAAMIASATSTP